MWVWVCGIIYRFLEVTSRVSSTQIFIYNNTLIVSLTWSFMRMTRRSIENDCARTLEWDSHVCVIVYNQLCRGCRGLWSWFPGWWGEEFSSFLNRFFCPMSLGFDGISTSCMGWLNHWSRWVNLCLPTPGMIIPNAMALYVSQLSPSRSVTLFLKASILERVAYHWLSTYYVWDFLLDIIRVWIFLMLITHHMWFSYMRSFL